MPTIRRVIGRRADLLGLGQRAEGDGRPPNTSTDSAEARAARQSHRLVLAAQAAQQVDRGGVEPVGDAAVDGR